MNEAESVLRKWNSMFPEDPTTLDLLNKKFFLSDYISKVSCIEHGGAFSLAGTRARKFLYNEDMENSWILWLGFTKKKDLEAILDNQVAELRSMGKKLLLYSSFTPDYFLPGIDRKMYPEIYEFLIDYGFSDRSYAVQMSINLRDYRTFPETDTGNTPINYVDVKLSNPLLNFVMKNFSSDWYYRVKNVLEKGEREQISVAYDQDRVIGFSMFSGAEGINWPAAGERFGPFGVSPEYRGSGIGARLLDSTLSVMKGRGIHTAYFLWTDDRAARLYHRFGFKEERRFEIMELEL